jgi:hypothetical protein
MHDAVYCCFNMQEVIEDNLATPGIDRGRRFWSILPNDWLDQRKTYHDIPYTAAQILGYLRTAPTVHFGWVFSAHAAQSKPVFAVDANNGPKLGNVLQEMAEKQGLVFTIVGQNTLVFAMKGDGAVPAIPGGAYNINQGNALSHNDTQIRVVGDRNRYQCTNVQLEPDWHPHFEQYWMEALWIARVRSALGMPGGTFAQEAALFARAKSVTLREYLAMTGVNASDYRKWGQVSRMDIPVWIYLQDIVFKAYRVPRSFSIGSSDWASLVISEHGLLQEVTYDPDTGVMTPRGGGQQYIEEKMLVLAKGYKVDLIDPKYQRALAPDSLADMRSTWWSVGNFSIDPREKTIVFQEAVFAPGGGGNDLFIFPNDGVDDAHLPANHPCRYIAVPNADATVSAAQVSATIVFEAERYAQDYGGGYRRGTHYARGLRRDVLLQSGVFYAEVRYADGRTADQKSSDLGNGLITRQAQYAHGGWDRRGVVGTALNGCIDRVTYSVRWGSGVEEKVEFTKERAPHTFQHERQLDRNSRTKELFPGAEQNREEVWELLTLSRLGEGVRTHKPPVTTIQAVMGYVYGNPHAGNQVLDLGSDVREAGEVIWQNKTSGAVDDTGPIFAGVVIADGSVGRAQLATQGIVPVKIKGPFKAGDPVGETSGDNSYVKTYGERRIGVVNADYQGKESVLAPVRLGASVSTTHPFQVVPGEAGEGGGDGWVKVILNSWLLENPNPTSKITITKLDTSMQLAADDRIWLEISLEATYNKPPGPITAKIARGRKWGDGAANFYPLPVQYNTDDGTRLGSSGKPPANTQQTLIFIPIGYATTAAKDPFKLVENGYALSIGDDLYFIQQLVTHLMMGSTCIDGGEVQFALPSPFAPQPEDS